MIAESMKALVKGSSVIRAMFEEGNRLAKIYGAENVYDFSLGNPNVPAPDEVNEAIKNIVDEEESVVLHGYMSNSGFEDVREAIAQSLNKRFDTHFNYTNIVMTVGAAGGLNTILKTIINPGDEVLTFAPFFGEYRNYVSNFGGKLVAVSPDTATFQPKFDEFEKLINKNTKAVIVNNPNNPTGALYPDDLLKEIVEIARQNDLIIFADEIYDRLVMDGKKHTAIASLAPDVFCVSMNGLSKSHRICGFRVGWMVLSGPKHNVKGYIEGLNMLANMRLCANVLGQNVVQTSLGGYQSVDELLIPGGRIYEQRNFIYKAVNEVPGLSAVKPEAGLYIFPKIDRDMYQIDDDEQFCLELLKQEKVMLVPGKGFNWTEPDHFRIVYLPRVEELAEVQEKLTRVLSQYKR